MSEEILKKLSQSKFRDRFKLNKKYKDYVALQGMDKIEKHAKDFIAKRIARADIPNDGKQTPMKNHPVFIAQHATATCCRKCINKWHRFEMGMELNENQQEYIVGLIMLWIEKQMK